LPRDAREEGKWWWIQVDSKGNVRSNPNGRGNHKGSSFSKKSAAGAMETNSM